MATAVFLCIRLRQLWVLKALYHTAKNAQYQSGRLMAGIAICWYKKRRPTALQDAYRLKQLAKRA